MSASASLASNDFDAPGLFGASDGFSYFVFEGSVPYKIIPSRQGFTGWSPQTKKIMGAIQQNFNPNDQGEDDLDEYYQQVLAEFRCHGESSTTGHCEVCGLEVWEPDWSGRNYFDEEEEAEAAASNAGATASASSSAVASKEVVFVDCGLGDRVMATWKHDSGTEYAAKVVAVNADGTLSLHYDDGSRDAAVPATYIKAVTETAEEVAAKEAEAARLREASRVHCGVGDRVMATWKGPQGTEYAAKVAAINADGTLSLHYDDGSRDAAVPFTYIKTATEPAAANAGKAEASREHCGVGDRVKATWKGPQGTEYAAKVVAINEDGTLSLHYDDGSRDAAVPFTYIKSVIETAASAEALPQPSQANCGVGDRVMATWKRDSGTEYAAKVVAINADGTLSLHYDDGSRDAAVPTTYIKSITETAEEVAAKEAEAARLLEASRVHCVVGDRVMATWKHDGGTEYAAKVVAINEDGTLSLHYDDGSRDAAVPFTYIKSKL